MKIRFSKVATLVLAGVALLAAGCTDYQSDINDIYTTIDGLASKQSVADLSNQVAVLENTLEALKTKHDGDIANLQSSITKLEAADKDFSEKIGKLNTEIASTKTSLEGTKKELSDLKKAYEEYKKGVNAEIKALGDKCTSLEASQAALDKKINELGERLDKRIDDFFKQLNDETQEREAEDAAIRKDLKDLKDAYEAYVASNDAVIEGLKTRLDAAEEAIENIEGDIVKINETIEALKETDKQLKQEIKDGDQYVLDSLNKVKAATDLAIEALKESVKDIVAVNKAQSDSLKKAFAKFDDYVLTTTFEAYQATVEGLLAAKADTATVNAAIRAFKAKDIEHDGKIAVLEAYKTKLEDEIIPDLVKADLALNARVDELAEVVGDIKTRVEVLEEEMLAAKARINTLEDKVEDIEGRLDLTEEQIAALLAQVQSVEFIPDYSDDYATIEFVALFKSGTAEYLKVKSSLSKITYRFSPASVADSLIKIFENQPEAIADASGVIRFDVVPVTPSLARFADGDQPALNIVKIAKPEAKDRKDIPGAITFTVLPENVDDFNLWALSQYHNFMNVGTLVPNMLPKGNCYASCLVINNADELGNTDITSEYSVWMPKGYPVYLDGFWRPTANAPATKCIPVEYTDTDAYAIADGVEFTVTVGGALEPMTLADFKTKYGVDCGILYSAMHTIKAGRPWECDPLHTNCHELGGGVLAEGQAECFVIDPEKYELAPEFTVLKSQLDASVPVEQRRVAIECCDSIYYAAYLPIDSENILVSDFYTGMHVTKVQAKAALSAEITWNYALDTFADSDIFDNDGAYDYKGEGIYKRENVALTLGENNFEEKGVKIADFDGAGAHVVEYTLTDKAGVDVTADVTAALELNADKTGVVIKKLEGFKWDEEYKARIIYDLQYTIDTIDVTVKTIDRVRKPVVLNYGPYEIEYKKDFSIVDTLCGTLAAHVEKHEKTLSVVDAVRALGYDMPVDSAFVKDNIDHDIVFINDYNDDTHVTGYQLPVVADPCVLVSVNPTYEDFAEVGDTLKVSTEYYTWYGQKVEVNYALVATAPKLDFRHNTFRVFADGGTETESHITGKMTKVSGPFYTNVEPYYKGGKWNSFEAFDVVAVNLPEAFVVVDENMVDVPAAKQAELGLKISFAIENADKSIDQAKLKSNTDSRTDTYVTIDDNMLKYHGYEEMVPVKGHMSIVNTDGSEFKFKTSFDEGFKAIYAEKVTDGTPVEGRYSKYEVVKFNPLHGFESTGDAEIIVTDAKLYNTPILTKLSLKDQRVYDPEDEDCNVPQAQCDNGMELFDGKGGWIVGDGTNGYKTAVVSKDAYQIADTYKHEIEGTIDPDIAAAIQIVGEEKPELKFNYEQQMQLTKPIVVEIVASLLQPWEEGPMETLPVKVTIRKSNVTNTNP